MSLLALTVIAGLLAVLAVAFVLVLTSRLDRQADDELRVRAQAASTTVAVVGGQVEAARDSATDSELDSSVWIFTGIKVLHRPRQPAAVQHAARALAASNTGYVDRAGRRFYVLALHDGHARIGTVIAAIETEPFDRTRDTIVIATAVVMGAMLIGVYPILRVATGRALRPVTRMSDQAAEWSVNAPDERFGQQDFRELNVLAGNLDELLDRLAAIARHERHLSAELSHEVRTPLTRMRAQADLLRADARADQIPEIDAIIGNCAAMDDIMNTLLAAARSELTAAVGRCELPAVLDAFAAELGELTVHVTVDRRLAAGVDRDLIVRMLSPIFDNARRYATSEISVTARRRAGAILIAIANDGPRLAPDDAQRIFEPGVRIDRSGDHPTGAGLGLALARRLARAADGDLKVDLAARQMTFVLSLPAG